MFTQRVWAQRIPVALTAMTATVGTVLAGGAAYAAPKPDPIPAATTKSQATVSVADAIRQERAKQPVRNASKLATSLATLGDIDGDGKTDLAAIDASGALYIYPGKGVVYSGTGPRPTTYFNARYAAGSGWGSFTALVRYGDFNNDGKQDIVGRDSTGRLWLYAGTGTKPGIVRNKVQIGSGWGNFKSIVGIGDADGDGFDDLMARKADGTLVIYYGTGNVAAPFRKTTLSGGSGFTGDLFVSLGDSDGNGRGEFYYRKPDKTIQLWFSGPTGFPEDSFDIFDPSLGTLVKNIDGVGDLVHDADFGGFTGPLPDDLIQFSDGSLDLFASDTGPDFNPAIGTGWAPYRIF